MRHSCDSPPLATEPRRRPGRPSVVLRLGVWIAAIASLAMVSILASITVAELSSGEARAINLAGSLRMQSYLIDAVVSSRDHAGNLQAVEQAFTEFEARYRDPELKRAIPRQAGDAVRAAYDDVGAWWSGRFRPAAARAMSSPPNSISLRTDTAEMVTRIDRLVALVEEGLETKLQWLRLIQGVSLALLLVLGASAVLQLKRHVLRPLGELLASARIVQRGNFNVRVPAREPDELGQLGEAFNFMVEDLSRIYGELESRVQEKTEALARSNRSLQLLYRTTHALSEKAVTRDTLLQVLQDVEALIGLRAGALCLGRSGLTVTRCLDEGRPALVGYLPVGYPDVPTSLNALKALCTDGDSPGVDLVEIGLPYSDPMLDGPVIQRAGTTALRRGVRTRDVFAAVEAVASTGTPAVCMTYWSLVDRYGVDAFARDFANAGGAGLITPDLTPDEAQEWMVASDAHDLDRIFLVAPSSTDERILSTTAACRGW